MHHTLISISLANRMFSAVSGFISAPLFITTLRIDIARCALQWCNRAGKNSYIASIRTFCLTGVREQFEQYRLFTDVKQLIRIKF